MSAPATTVEIVPGALAEADRNAVLAVLLDHNRVHNAGWWTATQRTENAPRPLAVLARDGDGRVIGGLTGSTQLAWLRLEVLAVEERARRRGIGRRLLAVAEEEALRRGCRHALADAMAHQAPALFRRSGYVVAGTLEDWDSHGQTKYLLVKALAAAPP